MVYIPHSNFRSIDSQQACHSAITRAELARLLRMSACQLHRCRLAHKLSLRHAHSCSFCSSHICYLGRYLKCTPLVLVSHVEL